MKVSWLILTFNRRDKVRQSVGHNWANCGTEKPDEVIWVDNGSTDGTIDVAKSFDPSVLVLNRENLGVAKGYNRAMALATQEFMVITGCDMLMPDGWLDTFKKAFECAPNTGVSCMYSKPIGLCPERARTLEMLAPPSGGDYFPWEHYQLKGSDLIISPALAIDRRMMRRNFQRQIGYFNEGFGLYGWEDVEWAMRAERVARDMKSVNHVIQGHVPIHLGTEGIDPYKVGGDEASYHAFKQKEANDPVKIARVRGTAGNGFPYFNPYC